MKLKEISRHQVNPLNEALKVTAFGEKGAGGAYNKYDIFGARKDGFIFALTRLHFQSQGIRSEEDFNGITNEVLLAVLIDRMEGFQSGPFACGDNADALAHLAAALECLQRRTKERVERGVEGAHTA